MVGFSTEDVLTEWRQEVIKVSILLTLLFLSTPLLTRFSYQYWRDLVFTNKMLKEQKEKLSIVTDYTSDWEYWQGPNHEFMYMSRSCERITGYTKEEFITNPSLIEQIVHPEDQFLIRQHLHDHARQNENEESLDFRIIRRDGEVRWIAHVCSAVYVSDGQFRGRRANNRDITERKRFENKLKLLASIIEYSHDVIVSETTDGIITSWNPAAEQLLGYSASEIIGKQITIILPPDRMNEEQMLLARIARGETVEHYESVRRHKNGSDVHVSITLSPIIDSEGRIVGGSKIAHDITERKILEIKVHETTRNLMESEARLTALFENMSSGVAIYKPSPDGENFIFSGINAASERIENIRREDLIGKNVLEVFPGIKEFGLLAVLQRVWKTGLSEHFPMSFYQDQRLSGWRDNFVYKLPSGEVVAIYDDTTEKRRLELELERQAHTDYLTCLFNRRHFMEQGVLEFSRAMRYESAFSVLMFDIDHFKKVNDTWGHHAGDLVIRKVAETALVVVRDIDIVGRLGGEEFAIALPETNEAGALLVAERLRSTVENARVTFEGNVLRCTISVGIATIFKECANIDTLLNLADRALYEAKESGRNRVCMYTANST